MTLENQSKTHTCPNCGTTQVRRTHRVTRWDKILSTINIYPYYCLECTFDSRFHSFGRK